MKNPKFWLMDISNSFVKLSLSDGNVIAGIHRHPTPELTRQTIRTWDESHPGLPWIVCSVVPVRTELIAKALGKRAHFVTGKSDLGLVVDYPRPSQIGPDRLANAVAAIHQWGGPVIVLDFGTAVTFDVIDARPAYVGGVIAPGLNLMTDYLHEKTALLPRVTVHSPKHAIGRSTEEAMCAGAIFGYRGLVRGILKELRKELGNPRKLPVVATGGQAEIVCKPMREIVAINPKLTLDGLRQLGLRWLT